MHSALKKGYAVIAVALLLLIPLMWLGSLVRERTILREQAIAAVARGWGGRQALSGPVLAIPITWTNDDKRVQTNTWYVLPDSLQLDVEMVVQPERRKLGVYEVPVYVARIHAKGEFNLARAHAKLAASTGTIGFDFEHSHLLLPVQDLRGVRKIEVSGPAAVGRFEPGTGLAVPTLSAPMRTDADLINHGQPFDLTFEIAGTQSLAFWPLAHENHVNLRGNWSDPGFARGLLPVERHVRNGRFDASWQALDLNRSFATSWLDAAVPLNELKESEFGVDLVAPVDLYQQVERAVKYAEVFICLSFLTLFIWEHLARRPVHPIQYGLLGLALSTFFLLLLALAEHVGFGIAYLVATAALCSLLSVYLAGTLRSARAAASSGGYFAVLYGFMYLLVTSDDYALLAGALGLFVILAIAMVLTRKIDWYQAA